MGETPCDLAKPRVAPYKNTWKRLQTTVFWCNLKLAQEIGLQYHQTRSHAVVLHNTLPAACIEKAVCMKTQDELHQKFRSTLGVLRVVLKSNSQHGLQDPQNQDARSSWEPSSDSKSTEKSATTPWIMEYRVPVSAVEHQNKTERTKTRSWSRSSRTSSTRNPSFKT